MPKFIYDKRGNPFGFIHKEFIHTLQGQAIGQLCGSHVHSLSGSYVGELHKDMIVDKNIGDFGNIGHPGDPGNPGSFGIPTNRGVLNYGYQDVSHKLLDRVSYASNSIFNYQRLTI